MFDFLKKKQRDNFNNNLRAYNRKFTEPFGTTSNEGQGNKILTQNVSLSLDTKKTGKNNNVLLVGDNHRDIVNCFMMPNILQANSNYVIVDKDGEILKSTRGFLEREHYEVKVFNLCDMNKSDKYNPFCYIHSDEDILSFVKSLLKSTTPFRDKKFDLTKHKNYQYMEENC